MATKAEQHWQLKHGRPKRFTTPEQLWNAACEFFQWCEDNPLKQVKYAGSKAKKVQAEIPRPFTLSGLRLHLKCGVNYFSQLKARLLKTDPNSELLQTVQRIELIIYEQKFVGAAVGIYNVSIIARDLGLMNRKETRCIEPKEQAVYGLS